MNRTFLIIAAIVAGSMVLSSLKEYGPGNTVSRPGFTPVPTPAPQNSIELQAGQAAVISGGEVSAPLSPDEAISQARNWDRQIRPEVYNDCP